MTTASRRVWSWSRARRRDVPKRTVEYGIHVEFKTVFAAFDDDRAAETARILRACADRVEAGYYCGPLTDANGNAVGFFTRADEKVAP